MIPTARTPRIGSSTLFPALTTVGIVPFTKFTMDGINAALIAEGGADGGGGGSHVLMPKNMKAKGLREEEEVRELVTRWRFWNRMRMVMPFVGTMVGLWTALN